MAPIYKADSQKTGDKTHLGDAVAAFHSMQQDQDHGHYLILIFDAASNRVKVHLSGCNNMNESSHDKVLAVAKELEAKNMPCWGAYSWKAVNDARPGIKDHLYCNAAFLNIFPGCQDEEKVTAIKNRCRYVIFDAADYYQEFHSAAKLDSPQWWKSIREIGGEDHMHSDFGGGHTHTNEDCEDCSHHKGIQERRADINMGKDERRDEIAKACKAEQERRSDILDLMERKSEIEREINRKSANMLSDQEKSRRMAADKGFPSSGHEQRHRRISQELLHHETLHKLENRQRASAREMVNEKVAVRHDELKREWKEKDIAAEQQRDENGKLCKRILDAEQRRRSSAYYEEANKAHRSREISGAIHEELIEASELMERAVNQRASKIYAERERRSRMNSTQFPDPEVHKRISDVHQELRDSVIKL